MNYARSLTEPELPENMLNLLTQYLQIAPAMVPPPISNDNNLQHYGIQISILTTYLSIPNQRKLRA